MYDSRDLDISISYPVRQSQISSLGADASKTVRY